MHEVTFSLTQTFDFSDLSEEQLNVFRQADLVNPVPNPDKCVLA
jgi:hypothetical protein